MVLGGRHKMAASNDGDSLKTNQKWSPGGRIPTSEESRWSAKRLWNWPFRPFVRPSGSVHSPVVIHWSTVQWTRQKRLTATVYSLVVRGGAQVTRSAAHKGNRPATITREIEPANAAPLLSWQWLRWYWDWPMLGLSTMTQTNASTFVNVSSNLICTG